MEVIIHAAATSFIHMQMLATSQVLHSMRNTGRLMGAQAERSAALGAGGGGLASSGIRGACCAGLAAVRLYRRVSLGAAFQKSIACRETPPHWAGGQSR
jgi:hypothetical protein